VHTAEKVWRWYRRNASAAMIIAGAVTMANACVLVAWEIVGIIVCLLEIHPVASPWQAAGELAAVATGLYLPWLFIGYLTLNGSAKALWTGTALSLLSLLVTITMMAGNSPLLSLQVMQEARSSSFFRIQLSSLLMCVAAGVLAVHVIALVARHDQEQPPADGLTKSSRP
jgi:hypothetical protein